MSTINEYNLVHLIRSALRNARDRIGQHSGGEEAVTTTIRIPQNVKTYIEHVGNDLGLSWQQTVVLLLKSSVAAESGASDTISGIRQRLLNVFEWHGIDVVDASEILQAWGFTPAILADSTQTLERITNPLVEHVSTLFQVPRSYLLGQDDRPQIEAGNWYNNLAEVARQLWTFREENRHPRLLVLSNGGDRQSAFLHNDEIAAVPIGLVVQYDELTPESNRRFRAYRYWGVQRWNYWRCRVYAKALIRWCCERMDLSDVQGYNLTPSGFTALQGERLHIAAALHQQNANRAWDPTVYLMNDSGANPEAHELELVEKEYSETLQNL